MAKWTEEEIQYLKENYADTDIKILAKKLSRSKGAIYVKSTYLGLNRSDAKPKWTEEEVQYLLANYAETDNETLVKNLNRKIGTIRAKAHHLNLRKNKKNNLETGMKFGRLTILKEVKPISYNWSSKDGKTCTYKHRVFLCECDCGNKKEIRASELLNGGTKSCGCLRSEKGRESGKKLSASDGFKKYNEKALVDGTKLDQLNKIKNKNNTSGHKGVSWNKRNKKWITYITFQGKRIHLGYFDKKEDAIKARLKAEEEFFVPILEKHKDVFEQ